MHGSANAGVCPPINAVNRRVLGLSLGRGCGDLSRFDRRASFSQRVGNRCEDHFVKLPHDTDRVRAVTGFEDDLLRHPNVDQRLVLFAVGKQFLRDLLGSPSVGVPVPQFVHAADFFPFPALVRKRDAADVLQVELRLEDSPVALVVGMR